MVSGEEGENASHPGGLSPPGKDSQVSLNYSFDVASKPSSPDLRWLRVNLWKSTGHDDVGVVATSERTEYSVGAIELTERFDKIDSGPVDFVLAETLEMDCNGPASQTLLLPGYFEHAH
jgi:hypothetical protein